MSEPAPILEVSYDVTVNDAVAFAVYHHHASPLLRRRRRFLRVGMSALLAMIAATIAGVSGRPVLGMVGLAFAFGFWLIFPRRYEKGLRESVAKLYTEGKNLDLLGPTKLVLDTEGMTESTPTRDSRSRWAVVERCVETEDHVFVYLTGDSGVIVPKRSLRPGEAERLIAEVRQRMPSRSEAA